MAAPIVLDPPNPDSIRAAFVKVNANFVEVIGEIASAEAEASLIMSMLESLAAGTLPGWSLTPSGGTAEEPGVLTYASDAKRVEVELTWSAGNVTQAVYRSSNDSGATWAMIGTQTITYDANNNVTGVTWA